MFNLNYTCFCQIFQKGCISFIAIIETKYKEKSTNVNSKIKNSITHLSKFKQDDQ